jgi:hypothetical protein
MDKQHFDQLVKGVREMKRHMAGKSVRGARTTELPEPDPHDKPDPPRTDPAQRRLSSRVNHEHAAGR